MNVIVCGNASSLLTFLVLIVPFTEKPMRFVVSDVYAEGKGVSARGRVVQGFMEAGERVVVLPIGDPATVHKLEHLQPPAGNVERLALAMAGDTVELVLTGIDLMRISVGSILANQNSRPTICKKGIAKILVMENLSIPIIRGAQVLFHMHSLDVPVVLTKLIAITNRDGSIKKERPRALTGGASAIVEFTLSDKICMEPFSECRALGRFVLRRGGDTIAVGILDSLIL
jgi:elongation factor 1 alpha-like protein